MGFFDTVQGIPGRCPHCKQSDRVWAVQFKYGHVLCNTWALGDDIGGPKGEDYVAGPTPHDFISGLIVTPGVAVEGCPDCGKEVWAAVYILDGKLWRVGLLVRDLAMDPKYEGGEFEVVKRTTSE